MQPIITLLSDFGTADAYVGAMKGAVLSVNPETLVVDITHDVPPQDVVSGAWLLAVAYRYFPPGSVHVAVVDPGVGGERRAIAARAGGWYFVAPDNGVLSWVFANTEREEVVELRNSQYFLPEISHTFHGRDIFAPVAAHIAAGVPLSSLGPAVADPVMLPLPELHIEPDVIRAQIAHVDRFGNLITNLDVETLQRWQGETETGIEISAAARRLHGVRDTYGSAERGDLLALIESSGYLEIAVREGSAGQVLGLRRGDAVEVRRKR